jgi:hypothetical protein
MSPIGTSPDLGEVVADLAISAPSLLPTRG